MRETVKNAVSVCQSNIIFDEASCSREAIFFAPDVVSAAAMTEPYEEVSGVNQFAMSRDEMRRFSQRLHNCNVTEKPSLLKIVLIVSASNAKRGFVLSPKKLFSVELILSSKAAVSLSGSVEENNCSLMSELKR